MMRLAYAAVMGLAMLVAVPAAAQEPAVSPGDPVVEGSISNLTRVETWRFFEPPLEQVNPDYTFWGNRSDLDVRVRMPRVDLEGGFSYVRAEHLPQDAIGPGGLGTGAFYFAASGQPYSYQVFLTSLSLSLHDVTRRRAVRIGRMPYTSGMEGEDARVRASLAGDEAEALASTRRMAIAGRLVGTFGWSLYQRRFDGARVDWQGDQRYVGGTAFLVTQGGYEESANLTMPRLLVGTAYAGQRHGGRAESQVFGVFYRDRRQVDIRPDNSGVPVEAANVTIGAAGASHVAARPAGRGVADYAAWGAWQAGDWYGQTHRAYGVAAQGGYRWTKAPWAPWARAGASLASGDGDGRDGRHDTFFPMLQETRTFAQSMVYAHANLRDLFVQVLARPHARADLRVDVHRLDLAQDADRWYHGSGATARDGRFFGFSTRGSSGARGLGTVLEAAVDLRLSRYWSVNGYAGRMWGGPVVRGNFTGDRLFFWYVENVLRLDVGR